MKLELIIVILVLGLAALVLSRWTIARAILVETLQHPLRKATIVIRKRETKIVAEEELVKSRPAI